MVMEISKKASSMESLQRYAREPVWYYTRKESTPILMIKWFRYMQLGSACLVRLFLSILSLSSEAIFKLLQDHSEKTIKEAFGMLLPELSLVLLSELP